MSPKPAPREVAVTLRLPADVLAELQAKARALRCSIAELVELAVLSGQPRTPVLIADGMLPVCLLDVVDGALRQVPIAWAERRRDGWWLDLDALGLRCVGRLDEDVRAYVRREGRPIESARVIPREEVTRDQDRRGEGAGVRPLRGPDAGAQRTGAGGVRRGT